MRRNHIILNLLLAAGAVGAGVGGYLATGSSTATSTAQVRSTAVERGTVLSTISSSGNLQAAQSFSLSFSTSGTLTALWVKAGQKVVEGQKLAQIDPATAQQTVRTTHASLLSAQANYQSVLQGLTPEQQQQNAISVRQAALSLANAKASVGDMKDSVALDVATQAAALKQARAALVTARDQAALDTKTLAAAVVQAQASLDQVKATVAANEKSLQTGVDQARKALELARPSTGLSAAGAKATLDQARAQLVTDQAKLNADIGTLNGIVGATDGARTSVQSAQAAITNDSLQLQKITEYQTASGCTTACPAPYDSLSQKQLQFRQTQDQAVLAALNAISADGATITKDEQAVTAAQRAVDTNGLTNEQSLTNATNAYNGALTALQKALISDAQTLANSQNQLQTALNNQVSGKIKDDQSVANAENSLRTALTNQQAARAKNGQSLQQAATALKTSQLSFENTRLGNAIKAQTTPTAVAQARASVEQATAGYKNALESVDATILRAPTTGTIATLTGVLGATVGSGGGGGGAASSSAFITLVDLTRPLVLVGFGESDAAKVKAGQPATLTVSALPTVQLAAHVVALDTVSTVVSNVVTYYATLQLDRSDTGVKPGMTVNATVIIGKADDVLTVPNASVRSSGGTGTVTVVDAKGVQSQVTVTTGLQGDERTAILSGLEEGDLVVTASGSALAGLAAATSTTAGGAGGFGGRGGRGGFGGGGLVPRGLGG